MYSGSLREAKANAPRASGSTLAGANGSPSVAPHSGHGRGTSSKRGGAAPGWAAAASGEAREAAASSGIIATADPYRDSRLFPIASRTRHRGVAEERERRPYNRAACEGRSPRTRSSPLTRSRRSSPSARLFPRLLARGLELVARVPARHLVSLGDEPPGEEADLRVLDHPVEDPAA